MEYLLPGLVRWAHIVAGIAWIGLLYYFNLVQMAEPLFKLCFMGGQGVQQKSPAQGHIQYLLTQLLQRTAA